LAIDNEKFIRTAVRLAIMTNTDADNVRASMKPGQSAVEVSKKLGFVSDVQIGTILSSMYSQGSEEAGGLTMEGERCVFHPGNMATRSCHRCSKPLCPSCGLTEDGFTFCAKKCLSEYQLERDAVFASQKEATARKRNKILAVAAAVVVVVGVVGFIIYSKVSISVRLGNADEFLEKAVAATGQQRLDLLNQALRLNPALTRATELMPQAYFEMGNYPVAEQKARELIDKNPNNQDLKKILARSLSGQKRDAEALPIYSELNKQGALTVGEVREIGLRLASSGMLNDVLPWLQDALKRQEQDREVALILGTYYMNKSDYETAHQYLEAAVDNTIKGDRAREVAFQGTPEKVAGAYVMLVRVLMSKRDTSKMNQIVSQLNTLKTKKLTTESTILRAYEMWVPVADVAELTQIDSAMKLMSASSTVPGITRVLGLLESRKGNAAEASRLLEKSLLENPKDTDARRYLMDYYITQGRYGEARTHLVALREMGTTGVKMEVAEAIVLDGEGKGQEALRIAEKVLAENPDNPEVLGVVARIFMDTNRAEDAIKAIDRLMSVSPSIWSYFQGMLFSLQLGDRETAIQLARRAEASIASVPADMGTNVRRITGIVCGETDAAAFTEGRVVPFEARIIQKPRNEVELITKVGLSAALFSYMAVILSGEGLTGRNAAYGKISTPAYQGVTITDPFARKLSGPIADASKEGFTRLMVYYESDLPSGDWKTEFTAIGNRFQNENNRAQEGAEKVGAMFRALRDAGLLCYQANRNLGGGPGKPTASVAVIKERFELEENLTEPSSLSVTLVKQALETFALATTTTENGGLAVAPMSALLRDDRYNASKVDSGLEQLAIHLLYFAKAIVVQQQVVEATNLSGALRQTVLTR